MGFNRSGAFFEGNIHNEAGYSPFAVAGRYRNERGRGLAKDINGIVRQFDYAYLRKDRLVPVPLIMIIGQIGAGKTTIAIEIAKGISMLSVRGGKRARLSIPITKRSDEAPEYASFVNFLGSEPVDLADRFADGINIWDKKLPLSFSDHLKNMRIMLESDSTKLSSSSKNVLRLSMHEAFQAETPHVRGLNDILTTIDEEKYAALTSSLNLHRNKSGGWIPKHELDAARYDLSARLNYLMSGEIGDILNGDGSLSDVMTQNVVSFDYTGLEPEVVPFLKGFVWRIKSAAVRNNDNDYFCDVELHDENYEDWESMVYASGTYSHVKKMRGKGSAMILVSQLISDYLSIDGPQGKLAKNMLSHVGVWVIGQHDEDHIPLIVEKTGIKAEYASSVIPVLPPGSFVVKIGSQEPSVWHYERTQTMVNMSNTDEATERNLRKAGAVQ